MKKHRGFKEVQKEIAKKEGVSMDSAGAILASASRNASPEAKKANPRLNNVKMGTKAGNTDYAVTRKSKSSEAQGLEEVLQSFDSTFPSVGSEYKEIPGTSNSQVVETMIPHKGGVPKGY